MKWKLLAAVFQMDKPDMCQQEKMCTRYNAYRGKKDPVRNGCIGKQNAFLELQEFSDYSAQYIRGCI